MIEREQGYEAVLTPERTLTAAQYAYLEYLLFERERKIVELTQENEWLMYDQLTGVLVDKVIRVKLDQKVEQAHESNEPFALLFGDVDNLKAVNTLYGHNGGDAVIAAVGRACRRGDIVGRADRREDLVGQADRRVELAGRPGGDELWLIADLKPREAYLAVNAPHLTDPTPEHQASLLARSFERRANEEIKNLNLGPQVGFSVGVAVYQKGDTAKDLIARANQDMVNKKEHNKALRQSQTHHLSEVNP